MQQAPTFTLDGFLDRVHRSQQVAANYVQIESEADPKVVGRTAHRLTGSTRSAIALRSARILEEAERDGGYGEFLGPVSIGGGLYRSLGYTIVSAVNEAAE